MKLYTLFTLPNRPVSIHLCKHRSSVLTWRGEREQLLIICTKKWYGLKEAFCTSKFFKLTCYFPNKLYKNVSRI